MVNVQYAKPCQSVKVHSGCVSTLAEVTAARARQPKDDTATHAALMETPVGSAVVCWTGLLKTLLIFGLVIKSVGTMLPVSPPVQWNKAIGARDVSILDYTTKHQGSKHTTPCNQCWV